MNTPEDLIENIDEEKGNYPRPYMITFSKIGDPAEGYLSVCEDTKEKVPFEIKRIFWAYFTPESITRGRHAHKKTQQVLVAAAGTIKITLDNGKEQIEFVIDSPNKGVYIPPNYWHVMQYSHNAVQVVFASTEYDESDYLRNYDEFTEYWCKE